MPKWLNSFWPRGEKLAHGYTDAKYALVFTACLGELLQGGLVFGWNALALMLTARGTYTERCNDPGQREALPPSHSTSCRSHNHIPNSQSTRDILSIASLIPRSHPRRHLSSDPYYILEGAQGLSLRAPGQP